MNCPYCGSRLELYGLPAGAYGGSFKCYGCGPYGAVVRARDVPDADVAFSESKALSASNASHHEAKE